MGTRLLGVVVAMVLGSAIPATARAQDTSQSIPIVSNERPTRFVLTGGGQVIGTRISEDAETWTVQTAQGLVRVRKLDIAYMDFRTGAAAPPPVAPTAPPVVVAASPPPPAPPPERSRRKGLLRAGITGLAVSYGITAGIGAIASIWEPDANWLLMPVAGPLLYYQVGDLDRGVLGLLLLSTVFQAASLVALVVGIVVYSRDDGGDAGAQLPAPPRLAVTPLLSPDLGGLALSLHL